MFQNVGGNFGVNLMISINFRFAESSITKVLWNKPNEMSKNTTKLSELQIK